MGKTKNLMFELAKVVSVDDHKGTGQIQVRLPSDNQGRVVSNKDLPWAFPLLPKMVHIKPKVGEAVIVFTQETSNNYGKRYWLGPINSQLDKINFDSYETSALSALPEGATEPSVNPNLNTESKGIYPNDEEVALLGRGSGDIIVKDEEVLVRVGKNTETNRKFFNKDHIAYIKMKNGKRTDEKGSNYETSITIVSDKINFISHNSAKANNIDISDETELISDTTMAKIMEISQSIPYGDKLMEFMKLFLTAFNTHSHNYPGLPPARDKPIMDLNSFDTKTILSDDIKIL
ncbi:MAG: phage baseplate assembly protein V [Novosphingobium sp.]|nr:phage baseplate assembly protein V [Novosphingobium sp.]